MQEVCNRKSAIPENRNTGAVARHPSEGGAGGSAVEIREAFSFPYLMARTLITQHAKEAPDSHTKLFSPIILK